MDPLDRALDFAVKTFNDYPGCCITIWFIMGAITLGICSAAMEKDMKGSADRFNASPASGMFAGVVMIFWPIIFPLSLIIYFSIKKLDPNSHE